MNCSAEKMKYKKIKMYGWNIRLLKNFPSQCPAESVISNIDNGLRSSTLPVPASKYAAVFRFNILFSNKTYCLFLKIFRSRSKFDFIKHLIRRSRAHRAFKAGIMLENHGFAAPQAVMLAQKNLLGIFHIKNFLITAEVKDSTPFHLLMVELNSSQKNNKKRLLIKQLAQTIGKMHNAGIFHGDLRLGNILVQKSQEKFKFNFLDNERTKKYRTLPAGLRIKNLVQLGMFEKAISTTDRIRFYKAYLKQCPECKKAHREIAVAVSEKTAKRLAAKTLAKKV